MRPQFSALGVDDLELLFDAEGKAVHEGDDTSVVSRQSLVVSLSRQSQSSVGVGSRSRQSESAVGRLALLASLMQNRRQRWPNGWKI